MIHNKIARTMTALFSGVGTFIGSQIGLWILTQLIMTTWFRAGRQGSPWIVSALIVSTLSVACAAFMSTMKFGGLGFTFGTVFGLLGAGVTGVSVFAGFGGVHAAWQYFVPALPLATGIAVGLWAERQFKDGAGRINEEQVPAAAFPGGDAVEKRMAELESKLAGFDGVAARLASLEARLDALSSAPPSRTAREAPLSAGPLPAPKPGVLPQDQKVTPRPPVKPSAPFEWDDLLEGRWLFRLGMGILILGVAFFLKFAFENQWIGPTGRVLMGFFWGVTFIVLGDRFQKKDHALYGQTLIGGGLVILYLSIFAAFHYYGFLGQFPAFCCLALVTTTAGVLALRYSSISIIIVAMLGGFATPALLSTGVVREVPLFSYLALLNLGVLCVSSFKNWRSVNLLAFLLTQIWLQGYFANSYRPEMHNLLFGFTTAYFLMFLVPCWRFNIQKKISSEAADLALMIGNAGIYFLTCYYRLMEGTTWEAWEAHLAVAVGLIYFLMAQQTFARKVQDKYLLLNEMALASSFLVIALPIAWDWEWVTVGWAMEALALLWLGFKLDDHLTRWAGRMLMVVSGLRLIMFGIELRGAYAPLFNTRSFGYLSTLVLMGAAIVLADREAFKMREDEADFPMLLPVSWNILLLIWICVEVENYLRNRYIPMNPTASLSYYSTVAYSVISTLYASALMALGLIRKSKPLRRGAEILFGLTAGKVLLVDMASLPLGSRVISFLVLGGLIVFISYFTQKGESAGVKSA